MHLLLVPSNKSGLIIYLTCNFRAWGVGEHYLTRAAENEDK